MKRLIAYTIVALMGFSCSDDFLDISPTIGLRNLTRLHLYPALIHFCVILCPEKTEKKPLKTRKNAEKNLYHWIRVPSGR